MDKAVFFDKDGTLVKNVPYNSNPDLIELEEGASSALKPLQTAGYRLVIVTNQSGVACGYFTEEALSQVERQMRKIFRRSGIYLDGFYFCPHHPEGQVKDYAIECECRKPRPGLILKAAQDLNVDLERSWMVGDILNDVEAGKRAGCKTILIDNGNETEWELSPLREPDLRVKTVLEAAESILSESAWQPRESNGVKGQWK